MAGPSAVAVRVLYQEARDHFQLVLDALNDLGDKASSLIRVNVLVLGVLVTGVSIILSSRNPASSIPPVLLFLLIPGFGALSLSTMFAIQAYIRPRIVAAVNAEDLEGALGFDLGEKVLLEETIRSYREGIEENVHVLDTASAWFARSLQALLAAVLLLSIATVALILVNVH